jgi:hypothetical protein
MQSIRNAQGHALSWQQQQPHPRAYELRSGETVFATLRWLQAFGSLAQADTTEGQWTFKRVGFWRPRVTVRILGASSDLMHFEPTRVGSGAIHLPEGRQLRWSTTGGDQTQWAWHAPTGQPLLRFSVPEGAASSGQVRIEPDAFALPDLSLLTPLGWYLTILLTDDSTAAGAT